MNYPLKIGQPHFLSLEEVLTLHRASIDAYGGADGVLDQGKLESSLAMPRQGFGSDYAHEFPFGIAAAYGFHLAMNHAFRDGNKRTAFAAMVVFLRMNGWNFEMPDEEAAAMMLEMIERHREKAWLATKLEESCRPRPSIEVRDFFSQLTFEQVKSFLDSGRSGTDAAQAHSERAQTMQEALRSIPAIQQAVLGAQAAANNGDQAAADRLYAMSYLMTAMYRLAEDMGYEW